MSFLSRLGHDLKSGLVRLRYGAAQAATRALEESELLRLRHEVRKLDARIGDLCRDLGERAMELHERSTSPERLLTDLEIRRGTEEVRALHTQRERLVQDMEEIRGGV